MAWLYEKSPAWRRLVAATRQSPLYMGMFVAASVAIPYAMAKVAMGGTNSQSRELALEEKLRRRSTVDHKVMARANRERLAVLLQEAQSNKSSSERYAAALNGESLGTHKGGTTTGAKSIRSA